MKRYQGAPRLGIVLGIAWAVGINAGIVGAQPICGAWAPVEAPAVTGAIVDVTAVSADDAWALTGESGTIHWDGTAWNQVALPDLSGLGGNFSLRATASLAPSSFFVAGIIVTSVWTTEQLLLTWDGSDWDRVESVELVPNLAGAPRYGSPSAIAAVAPDDLWIIGIATGTGDGVSGGPILAVHWDGSQLTEHFTAGFGNRQNNMMDAVAIATDDMWAVGEYNNTGVGDYAFHGLIYHYDGSSWSHFPNPTESIDSSHLNAVAAIATDDVWAAGDSPAGPLFLHWDGSSWTVVPGPPGVTGTVHKLAAISSNDVWAVDMPWQIPSIGKYYHWDGIAWSVVAPEIFGATSVARHGGLAAAGDCDVWAVGSADLGSGIEPFIERLQGGTPATSTPVVAGSGLFVNVVPNPIRHTARIRFAIPGDVPNLARIYDVKGRRVRALFEEPMPGNVVTWDGRNEAGRRVPGGVYFLRVESSTGRTFTEKLTVVR